jgi:hypothetical protein
LHPLQLFHRLVRVGVGMAQKPYAMRSETTARLRKMSRAM